METKLRLEILAEQIKTPGIKTLRVWFNPADLIAFAKFFIEPLLEADCMVDRSVKVGTVRVDLDDDENRDKDRIGFKTRCSKEIKL